MAEKPGPKETVTFKKALITNGIEIQTAVQPLFQKGIVAENQDGLATEVTLSEKGLSHEKTNRMFSRCKSLCQTGSP